jgi:ribosomal protein L34E
LHNFYYSRSLRVSPNNFPQELWVIKIKKKTKHKAKNTCKLIISAIKKEEEEESGLDLIYHSIV